MSRDLIERKLEYLIPTAHPGQILVAELLERDWTLTSLASMLEMDRLALGDFLNTHADLTPELAVKIALATGTTEQFWLNLQANFDAAHQHAPEIVDAK